MDSLEPLEITDSRESDSGIEFSRDEKGRCSIDMWSSTEAINYNVRIPLSDAMKIRNWLDDLINWPGDL